MDIRKEIQSMEISAEAANAGLCALAHCDLGPERYVSESGRPEGRCSTGVAATLIPVGIGHGHLPPGPCVWTGKVEGIVLDRRGELKGFYVQTHGGERHRFHSGDDGVLKLVRRAWEEQILTTVLVNCECAEEPLEVILHCASPINAGNME